MPQNAEFDILCCPERLSCRVETARQHKLCVGKIALDPLGVHKPLAIDLRPTGSNHTPPELGFSKWKGAGLFRGYCDDSPFGIHRIQKSLHGCTIGVMVGGDDLDLLARPQWTSDLAKLLYCRPLKRMNETVRLHGPIRTRRRSARSTSCKIIDPISSGDLDARLSAKRFKKIREISEGGRMCVWNERLEDLDIPAVAPECDVATPDEQKLLIVGDEMDALCMKYAMRQSNGNDPVFLTDAHGAAFQERGSITLRIADQPNVVATLLQQWTKDL